MKPKHQAIVAGLALSLTLGVAAPIPMFAQTDTVQQQDIAGNANADPSPMSTQSSPLLRITILAMSIRKPWTLRLL